MWSVYNRKKGVYRTDACASQSLWYALRASRPIFRRVSSYVHAGVPHRYPYSVEAASAIVETWVWVMGRVKSTETLRESVKEVMALRIGEEGVVDTVKGYVLFFLVSLWPVWPLAFFLDLEPSVTLTSMGLVDFFSLKRLERPSRSLFPSRSSLGCFSLISSGVRISGMLCNYEGGQR